MSCICSGCYHKSSQVTYNADCIYGRNKGRMCIMIEACDNYKSYLEESEKEVNDVQYYIPTPSDYRTVTGFLKSYPEAFYVRNNGPYKTYTLKPDWVFQGWHMLLSASSVILQDSDGVMLSSFTPLTSKKADEVKFYRVLTHASALQFNQIAEDEFKGYYKNIDRFKATVFSINQTDLVIRSWKLIIIPGENICPI